MSEKPLIEADTRQPERLCLSGCWQLDQLAGLAEAVGRVQGPVNALDASAIEQLDSAGALMLVRLAERFGLSHERIVLGERHRALFEAVAAGREGDEGVPGRPLNWLRPFEHVGQGVVSLVQNLLGLAGFLGQTLLALLKSLPRPGQWRVTATVHHMQQTGLDALPLVALLSFLIGAVVAFLGATVLRDFGAELFVVDLVAFAFLREMGVLLTAILLAGRTASAFTAQIGTMKSREEIDAMRTMGLDPIVLLVLPRLIALLLMLPVLSVLAVLAGLLGGLLVAVTSLGIPAELYISRVHESVELRHYLVGLTKAPLFAAVIALVGCMEGFKVGGTAQSVGERTTSAVVQSISLVIVIDALAAVFFMEIGW
jgi:phospholipid/cholesterol/gamma-HCH transport system permease protein